MSYETAGRKEVAEAVLIAALSSLAASLATWGVDSVKAAADERAKKRKKKKQDE